MERIKGKYDDLTNKIRPGTTWVAGFTIPGNNDDLRSIDVDGAEMRLIPESRYYASCTIKRGQAVSIAQLKDLSKEQANNKYAYVKITDPDLDENCLGIAMNYAEEGQIVQIQTKGKFNYYTTDSILYGSTSTDEYGNTYKREDREIFLKAKDWDFNKVRGQRLFIKKLYNNLTNADSKETIRQDLDENRNPIVADATELRSDSQKYNIVTDEQGNAFDTDHIDESTAADTTDWFTYDFIDSIYNAKHTIQIGYLTDAPTAGVLEGSEFRKTTNEEDQVIFQYPDNFIENKETGETEVTYKDITKPVIVIEKDESGKITIVDGSGEKDWWEKLKTENRLPKANEAIWLVKIANKENAYAPVDDRIVTIELDVTGDTRGPVDNTQFILTLGETIYFNTVKQDVELTRPNFNEGIFDEIKVLAIAQGDACGPMIRMFTKTNTTIVENPVEYGFIALRKLDGDTYIIPVLSDFTLQDLLDHVIDVNDEGYLKLSKQFTAGVEQEFIVNGEKIIRSPQFYLADAVKTVNRDSLLHAIEKGLKTIFVDDETRVVGCDTVSYNIGSNGFCLAGKNFGGYYDVYISQNLLNTISVTVPEHGQSANNGEAILADIRDANRLNIAGVVLSNQPGVRRKGETVKVMKLGRIVTQGNLKPGAQYFLGLNGRITAREDFWYDHCVPIGIADSANYLLIDAKQMPMHSYSGNFPIGYMKPSVFGKAEKGFVLTDGISIYSKEANSELYNFLLNFFDEEELKPSNVSPDIYNKAQANINNTFYENAFEEINKLTKNLSELQTSCVAEFKRIDDLDLNQNDRLTAIENLNAVQETHLANIDSKNTSQDEVFAEYKNLQKAKDDLQDSLFEAYKAAQAITNGNLDKDIKDAISKAEQDLRTAVENRKTDVSNEVSTLNQTIDSLEEKLTGSVTDAEDAKTINGLINKIKKVVEDQALVDQTQVKITDYEAFKQAQEANNAEQAQKITEAEESEEIAQNKQDANDQITALNTELTQTKEELRTVRENLDDILNVVAPITSFTVTAISDTNIQKTLQGDSANLFKESKISLVPNTLFKARDVDSGWIVNPGSDNVDIMIKDQTTINEGLFNGLPAVITYKNMFSKTKDFTIVAKPRPEVTWNFETVSLKETTTSFEFQKFFEIKHGNFENGDCSKIDNNSQITISEDSFTNLTDNLTVSVKSITSFDTIEAKYNFGVKVSDTDDAGTKVFNGDVGANNNSSGQNKTITFKYEPTASFECQLQEQDVVVKTDLPQPENFTKAGYDENNTLHVSIPSSSLVSLIHAVLKLTQYETITEIQNANIYLTSNGTIASNTINISDPISVENLDPINLDIEDFKRFTSISLYATGKVSYVDDELESTTNNFTLNNKPLFTIAIIYQ